MSHVSCDIDVDVEPLTGGLTHPSERYPEARALCAQCPVTAGCLEHALAFDEEGFWGGLTPRERQRIAHQRRAAGTFPTPKVDQSWRAHAACRDADPAIFFGVGRRPWEGVSRAAYLVAHLERIERGRSVARRAS